MSPAARRRKADRFVFARKDRLPAVLNVIGSARKRLILSLFRCDDFDILDALAAALQRKVDVRVLITARAKGWTRRLEELFGVLESMGATLYRYADPVVKYHAKYIVADEGPALVASLNFTRKCFRDTSDFLLTTHDPSVVKSLKRLFDADSRGPAAAVHSRTGSRLIVGPDRARRDLAKLIGRARRTIKIVDPRLTDPAMLDLLKKKRAAGVEVKVLSRALRGSFVPHGKMMLIDDSIGALGSLSLSALSLDFRREVAIVIRDRNCLDEMNRVFQRLAGASAAPRKKAVR